MGSCPYCVAMSAEPLSAASKGEMITQPFWNETKKKISQEVGDIIQIKLTLKTKLTRGTDDLDFCCCLIINETTFHRQYERSITD